MGNLAYYLGKGVNNATELERTRRSPREARTVIVLK